MGDEKKGSISFGFSKKTEKKTLKSSAISKDEPKESGREPDFLTSVEGKELRSTKKQEEAKELIIPLIEQNRYRVKKPEELEQDGGDQAEPSSKTQTVLKVSTDDSATDAAINEILREASRGDLSINEENGRDFNIPILMRNKLPEGFETDDKLDVSLRPDEAAAADYDEVPIDKFGIALLRGMGWKPGQGIGRNNETVKPLEAVLRPKGLGLGADKSVLQQTEGGKKNSTAKNNEEEEEQLELKAKGHCLVQGGKHQGLYGVVEGLDSDNARVMVHLTLTGDKVTLSQFNVKAVSQKEYKKNHKYLNKAKVDKFKEEQSKRSQQNGSDSESKHKDRHREKDRDKHRDRSKERHRDRSKEKHRDRSKERHRDRSKEKHRDRSKERHRDRSKERHRDRSKERHRERHRSNSRESSLDRERDRDRSRSHSKNEDKHKERKRRHSEDRAIDSSKKSKPTSNDGAKQNFTWMRPDLRVRVVDQDYQKGKYFKKKVVIEDVVSNDTCICRTEEGKVLEDVTQSMLETVIPRSQPGYVMLVEGKHKGQLAEILDKDKASYKATVQLLSDREIIFSIDYDRICEYTGDVTNELDY